VAWASQDAEKVLSVIPSEATDLLFFLASKKQQIPRANPALRNDKLRVFPQPIQPVRFKSDQGLNPHRLKPMPLNPKSQREELFHEAGCGKLFMWVAGTH